MLRRERLRRHRASTGRPSRRPRPRRASPPRERPAPLPAGRSRRSRGAPAASRDPRACASTREHLTGQLPERHLRVHFDHPLVRLCECVHLEDLLPERKTPSHHGSGSLPARPCARATEGVRKEALGACPPNAGHAAPAGVLGQGHRREGGDHVRVLSIPRPWALAVSATPVASAGTSKKPPPRDTARSARPREASGSSSSLTPILRKRAAHVRVGFATQCSERRPRLRAGSSPS